MRHGIPARRVLPQPRKGSANAPRCRRHGNVEHVHRLRTNRQGRPRRLLHVFVEMVVLPAKQESRKASKQHPDAANQPLVYQGPGEGKMASGKWQRTVQNHGLCA